MLSKEPSANCRRRPTTRIVLGADMQLLYVYCGESLQGNTPPSRFLEENRLESHPRQFRKLPSDQRVSQVARKRLNWIP